MRKIAFLGLLSITSIISACGNSDAKKTEGQTDGDTTSMTQSSATLGKIEFDESAFDFGKVKEGEVVEHTFTFKNTGNAPVILSEVNASCGCTTPDYSKNPVLPGKTGEVKVAFNSSGQVGKQQKIVTVMSNAENAITTVQIRGEVSKP